MKFSLFRRSPKGLATPPGSGQAEVEKALVDGFRVLSKLCGKMADLLEAQRLERTGFRDQGKFLERLDRGADGDGARADAAAHAKGAAGRKP